MTVGPPVGERSAFLGVENSADGRRWTERAADPRDTATIAQRHGLPEPVARALAARGIAEHEVEGFLDPSLRRDLPDPAHLLDMDKAAERVGRAILSGETVAVFGDYDVDGATSSALLKRFFEAVGGRLVTYIPDRIAEGYGPNLPALLKLKEAGAALAITVDCGIAAFDPLEGAAAAGLECIIVDHHIAEPRLPKAVAIVNPNRLDDPSPHGQLAAVGVTFLLIVAVNRWLREQGAYQGARREPDLRNWLDLVALGTVCDVVPLVGVNRALVTQGLKIMAHRRNPGLVALSDVARVDSAPSPYHLGFLLGPRVNAGGRVGEAALGAELLGTEDAPRALEISQRLDQFNSERRELEQSCLTEAEGMIENGAGGSLSDGLVFVASEGWHPGVIGIVASRLKEKYQRPACVVAFDDQGIGKGSGRSIEGVDLGAAVIAARQAELLINGGGHKMAAGFTVARKNADAFAAFLAERISEEVGPKGIVPTLRLDGAVTVNGASLDLIKALDRLQPFGAGNAEPRFAVTHARIIEAARVGENHVRLILTGEGGGRLKGIAFRAADAPLGAFLFASKSGRPIHLAGKLRIDNWQGREQPQILVDDAAPVDSA